ncbi:molybdopterin-dependent oxidoreductase [Paenibacillus sp. 2KB_22]|uniref:molybdopterin-dependent oxidoreductase n=1 Tax=Paenibacillus sp. 2KB_22 TaxID=3232978 RepID=UPI003F943527
MKFSGYGLVQNRDPLVHENRITNERDLFKVWHLGIPDIVDSSQWVLNLTGLVEHPLQFKLSDLQSLPQTSVTAIHECAGSPLNPKVPQRRIGNVVWGGVKLSDLLKEVNILSDAAYVISRGIDEGVYNNVYYSNYEKDLPLDKALDPNVLIALTINDEPITVERGGPIRLVVPGYYGTNSTKWLTDLIISNVRSSSAFTTKYYMDREMVDGELKETPVWGIQPNSIIVHPQNGQTVKLEEITIWGWAWAESAIDVVEVSVDGGETWQQTNVEPRSNMEWQRFNYTWMPKSVGEYCIMSRAKNIEGFNQPITLKRNQVTRVMIFVEQCSDL